MKKFYFILPLLALGALTKRTPPQPGRILSVYEGLDPKGPAEVRFLVE